MFKIEALDHVALAVRDVERSAQWYADVLGFKREHEGMWNGVPIFIGNGAAAIALFPARDKAGSMSHDRAAVRTLHFAFRNDRAHFLRAQVELKKRWFHYDFEVHVYSTSFTFI